MSQVQQIVEALDDLDEDSSVPKNIKEKINEIVDVLKNDAETSIKVNKALHLLDEISEDSNIKSYTRTQIWNIVSLLENI